MPFNGAGVFTRIFSWVTDRNAGVKILATRMDQEMDGFATGLSNTITRDGQSTVTQDIPFNNRKITGLGNATNDSDALNRITADGRFLSGADGSVTTAKLAATVARGVAKAWANLNGIGTIALRDSLNIASVVDNGNGSYTHNFTNAFSTANYSAVSVAANGLVGGVHTASSSGTDPTASAVRVLSFNAAAGILTDNAFHMTQVLGDLA
jgi:hypothetical protein